jgi:hypothetical protein
MNILGLLITDEHEVLYVASGLSADSYLRKIDHLPLACARMEANCPEGETIGNSQRDQTSAASPWPVGRYFWYGTSLQWFSGWRRGRRREEHECFWTPRHGQMDDLERRTNVNTVVLPTLWTRGDSKRPKMLLDVVSGYYIPVFCMLWRRGGLSRLPRRKRSGQHTPHALLTRHPPPPHTSRDMNRRHR